MSITPTRILSLAQHKNMPWWILHLLGFGAYLYYVLMETQNIPMRMDDIKFFLDGTSSRFLDKDNGFIDKVTYFFSMGNWPHPKIIGRLLGLISYYGLGEINFRFLLISGHLFVLALSWSLIKLSDLSFNWISLPVTLIILIPSHEMSLWAVSIIGFVPHILFAFLTYYFLQKGNKTWSIIFVFVTTFSSGPGFLVVLPAIFLLFFQKGTKPIRSILMLTGLLTLAFLAFGFLTIDWTYEGTKTSNTVSVDRLFIIGSYAFSFLGNSVRYIYQLSQVQVFLVGLSLVLGYLVLFIIDFRKQRIKEHFPVHALSLYIGGISIMAGVLRGKPDMLFQFALERYEIYSSAFIGCLIILLIKQFSYSQYTKTLSLIILVLSIIHFRLSLDKPVYYKTKNGYVSSRIKKLIVTPIRTTNGKIALSNYIESGLYQPPFDYINPIVDFHVATEMPKTSMDTSVVFRNVQHSDSFTYLQFTSLIRADSYHIVLADSTDFWISENYEKVPRLVKYNKVLIDRRKMDSLSGQLRIGLLINTKKPKLIMGSQVLNF